MPARPPSKRPWSLSSGFALGVGIAAVFLAMGAAYDSFERQTVLKAQALRLLALIGSRVATFDDRLERLQSDAQFLATTVHDVAQAGAAAKAPANAEWDRRLDAVFAAFALANPRVTSIRLIGVDNGGVDLKRFERSSPSGPVARAEGSRARMDPRDLDPTLRLRAGQAYVSDIGRGAAQATEHTSDGSSFWAASPVYGPDGARKGLLVLSENEESLFNEIRNHLPVGVFTALTNSAGDLVFRSDQPAAAGAGRRGPQRWRDEFRSLPRPASLPAEFTAYRTASGTVYALQRRIRLTGGPPDRFLTLTVAVPKAHVDGRVKIMASTAMVGVVGALSVLGLLLVLYLRQDGRVRVQQARLAALVEGSGDAIIGQTLDGIITDWNPAAERLFGYAAKEAVGQIALSLIIPLERRAEEADLLTRAGLGEFVPNFNTRRRRRDGTLVDVAVTVSPLYGADGRVAGVSKTVRDISEAIAAAESLRDARRILTMTTQAAGVGLWDWDLISGAVGLDDTALAVYGRPREGFDGSYEVWRRWLHPDDILPVETAIREAMAGRAPLDTTFRIETAFGERRHIQTKGVVWTDEAGRPARVLGINVDITADRARERQIEDLNASLEQQVAARTAEVRRLSAVQRAILSNAAHAIIATDVDGMLTVFNPAAERLYGYRAEEVIGRPPTVIAFDRAEMHARAAVLTAELGKPIEPGFETLVAKARLGGVESNEWTCIRKDRSRLPMLLSSTALRGDGGEIFGFLGIMVDLSERAEHERRLRESERMLKAVTDNIPSVVGYWDADLRCRFANNAYYEWFGRTSEQMVGLHMADLLGEDLFRLATAHVEGVMRGEPQMFESPMVTADGRPRRTLAHYIPDRVEAGVRGFYVLVSDVTELKAAQIDLEALNGALEVRTKEAEAATIAKSQFLANMSHEIRSPVNGILGMLQLLSGTALTDRQGDYVGKAASATRSMLHLLNDLLDFSKIEADKVALEDLPFSLSSMMAGVSAMASGNLGVKPVDLVFNIDPRLPTHVRGDEFRLQQVLLNLCNNAIKFTARGQVTVSATRLGQDDGRHRIEFSVHDTGIGIAPENLSTIFESFTQAEASITRRFGGVGLGLAICQRLVTLMGGALGVESRPGAGSRFHFSLELDAAAGESPAPGTTPWAAASLSPSGGPPGAFDGRRLAGLRILVVDDNPINRQVAEELLATQGALVAVASGGLSGLSMAFAADPPFDVVLMDVQMPDMDGLEAARELRQTFPAGTLPIIAMTANAMASDRAACLNAGMDDHIAKPIDLEVLVNTLLTHCGPPSAAAGGAATPGATGFDAALRRLGNNRDLFRTIASRFIREAAPMMAALRAAVHSGDQRAMLERLHTLKGLAGTVGISAVAAQAAGMEVDTKTSGRLLDAEAALNDLQASLRQGVAALLIRIETPDGAAPAAAPVIPAEPRTGAAAIDPALDKALVALDALLEDANMRALEVHAELQGLCGPAFAADLAPLAQAMDRLDFPRARIELGALARAVR